VSTARLPLESASEPDTSRLPLPSEFDGYFTPRDIGYDDPLLPVSYSPSPFFLASDTPGRRQQFRQQKIKQKQQARLQAKAEGLDDVRAFANSRAEEQFFDADGNPVEEFMGPNELDLREDVLEFKRQKAARTIQKPLIEKLYSKAMQEEVERSEQQREVERLRQENSAKRIQRAERDKRRRIEEREIQEKFARMRELEEEAEIERLLAEEEFEGDMEMRRARAEELRRNKASSKIGKARRKQILYRRRLSSAEDLRLENAAKKIGKAGKEKIEWERAKGRYSKAEEMRRENAAKKIQRTQRENTEHAKEERARREESARLVAEKRALEKQAAALAAEKKKKGRFANMRSKIGVISRKPTSFVPTKPSFLSRGRNKASPGAEQAPPPAPAELEAGASKQSVASEQPAVHIPPDEPRRIRKIPVRKTRPTYIVMSCNEAAIIEALAKGVERRRLALKERVALRVQEAVAKFKNLLVQAEERRKRADQMFPSMPRKGKPSYLFNVELRVLELMRVHIEESKRQKQERIDDLVKEACRRFRLGMERGRERDGRGPPKPRPSLKARLSGALSFRKKTTGEVLDKKKVPGEEQEEQGVDKKKAGEEQKEQNRGCCMRFLCWLSCYCWCFSCCCVPEEKRNCCMQSLCKLFCNCCCIACFWKQPEERNRLVRCLCCLFCQCRCFPCCCPPKKPESPGDQAGQAEKFSTELVEVKVDDTYNLDSANEDLTMNLMSDEAIDEAAVKMECPQQEIMTNVHSDKSPRPLPTRPKPESCDAVLEGELGAEAKALEGSEVGLDVREEGVQKLEEAPGVASPKNTGGGVPAAEFDGTSLSIMAEFSDKKFWCPGEMRSQMGFTFKDATITKTEPGKWADSAGLRVGDEIVLIQTHIAGDRIVERHTRQTTGEEVPFTPFYPLTQTEKIIRLKNDAGVGFVVARRRQKERDKVTSIKREKYGIVEEGGTVPEGGVTGENIV